MSEKLAIPASAFETKAWFSDRPSQAVVQEIKAFIKKTGQPHLWRGHTHTPPPRDGQVIYVGEFDLPDRLVKVGRLAPCPCCRPYHPKYGRGGKIAYFPNEQVIRMIGPECFASLNPEEHDRANTVFQAEKKRARNLHYLKSQLHKITPLIEAINANIPIAEAVDDFQLDLLMRLDKCLGTTMWTHVRDGGQLKVYVTRPVTRKNSSGVEEEFEEQLLIPFSIPLVGYQILERKPRFFARYLRSALTKLDKVDFPDASAGLENLDDEQLEKATKAFSRGYKAAKANLDRIREHQRFLSAMNLAVLKGWNKHEGCPIRIYVDLDGHELTVGQSEHNRQRFSVPPTYFHVLKPIPAVNEMSVNDADDGMEEIVTQVA